MKYEIHTGHALSILKTLPDNSVNCCITSPPYFGLRDYGVDGQIGLEETPQQFVVKLVEVFREVKRVLCDDGTCWVNLGDSYVSSVSNNGGYSDKSTLAGFTSANTKGRQANESGEKRKIKHDLPPKNLIGIPWRVAFALQDDGWILRQDIIWAKPNPMPESVADRCTKSHEYIFMLTKNQKYFYDQEAIMEPMSHSSVIRLSQDTEAQTVSNRVPFKTNGNMKAVGRIDKQRGHGRRHAGFNERWDNMTKTELCSGMRNKRDVWKVSTTPFKGAHFAVFPEKLIEPCVLAGCPRGGTVLDPFGGSGTTGVVANRHGRNAILIELNPKYAAMADQRLRKVQINLDFSEASCQ